MTALQFFQKNLNSIRIGCLAINHLQKNVGINYKIGLGKVKKFLYLIKLR